MCPARRSKPAGSHGNFYIIESVSAHVYTQCGEIILSESAAEKIQRMIWSDAKPERTELRRSDDPVWRRTQFLGMLARLGAPDRELAAADQMISRHEAALQQKGFPAAVEETAKKAANQFRSWCQRHGLDPEAMDEADLEQLLAQTLTQVRAA